MDTLRGNSQTGDAFSVPSDAYDVFGAGDVQDAAQEEGTRDAPPPVIGKDERRMQVRAYNFWASLLNDRNFPDIADLDPANAGDFGPSSVLLDFTHDSEDPRIAFLGDKLAEECDANAIGIEYLSDVPSRSLLSRITDHYMQILANQAPIGFEAEFVNQRGATILYRGILLPYSSNDHTIDFIYGVINWKELADQQTADELLLEIEAQLEPDMPPRRRSEPAPIADWADGPGSISDAQDILTDIDALDVADIGMDVAPHMALVDWLALAREQAQSAREREDRSRNALYEAIGRAWDFAIAASAAPDDFTEILADAGLSMQERAPMTPVVKLVFGAEYDKTRLTEYAAALGHAKRMGLGQGMLAEYLRSAEGGLKGVVLAERNHRRDLAGGGMRPVRDKPRTAITRRLRSLAPRSFASLDAHGQEFALVMVRRTDEGEVVLLGELPEDIGLIERAARQLLG